jgi:hypothetical protein
MLNNTNIIILVGGGKNPKYAPNKLIIWDDDEKKVVRDIRFNSIIKSVKIKREK